jgi:hypothetical protein
MRGAYPAVSYTARGDGETDSAMRRYVPQPSAIAQPATMLRIAHCEPGQDLPAAQSTANALGIVCPVPQHAVRATAWPTTRPLEQRNAIEQGRAWVES